ncbi:MAG: cation:proton antiporter [Rhodospirillales bacterium]
MPEHAYLQEVLILLAALLVFVPLFQRLRFGSMLGYLAAGVVIGPSGLGLVNRDEETTALAELGVVLLLFSIGLELSVERLRLFGRRSYALAIAQVVVTSAVLAGCAWLAGLSPTGTLVVGGALALSSTAVVLELLKERGEMAGQLGRTAIAILLVQDLAVAPMLIFIDTAGQSSERLVGALGIAAFKFIVIITLILLTERIVLRPLLKLAAGSGAPEVFTGATLLLVLGTGWATEYAGLSMALGAFLAGIMVADTEFRHQIRADIEPFRGLLLGLFFITIGMGLDIGYALQRTEILLLIVVGLLVIKTVLIASLAALFGAPRDRALALGGYLSQGSEFAFVLCALAAGNGLLEGEAAHVLTAAVGLSMAVTPIGALIVRRVLAARGHRAASALGNLEQERSDIKGHVVIAGFGQVGMAVARFLAGQRVPLLILDASTHRVTASRTRGLPVFYGNATRVEVLRAAHLERAHALVVAMPESATAEQVTGVARQAFPDLRIFTRVHDEEWVQKVRKAGADAVVPDSLTTALDLSERVMLFYRPEDSE